MLRGYINAEERETADRQLPRLMVEGLLLGGTGLGVLALIFEIAADAFSVAAYQTLLAIHGASGDHDVAIAAFSILSVMLFLGVVPAYKAASYLRPNAGGSGPLVEAIGPPQLRWASWVGTSLFFIDAILTIIISSLSASDVTMLILPELSDFRILLSEIYAFFIMAVLVALGPRRAVPLFLIGGAAFTVFTLIALGYVGFRATIDPELKAGTPAIVERLAEDGVVTEVIGGDSEQYDGLEKTGVHHEETGADPVMLLLFASMASAMLGFSGYEVIPASGKHAARPKWKVINTALTLAAVFLIGTGILQLYGAKIWDIPATEGYSTLLIEYELVFGQTATLTSAGILLSIILLLAQGGGYVGGAAVASNAARLGRLPRIFLDDRIGIVVIWGISAILIPIIREVVVVEGYYAFGFVSAFVITSTTVFFVRNEVLKDKGIEPDSTEGRSLKFAGLRGMIASYIMMAILITQKTDALVAIVIAGGLITAIQIFVANGGLRATEFKFDPKQPPSLTGKKPVYASGEQRAHDEARQRGIVVVVNELITSGAMNKFNVDPNRIRRLVTFTYGISPEFWPIEDDQNGQHEILPEPSVDLEETFDVAMSTKQDVMDTVEYYSHYGIFTFINKYSHNWVSHIRDEATVEKAMVHALFPLTDDEIIWQQFIQYEWKVIPEPIWQFCRQRYHWAKDQWPNLSDRITTIWTLQDLGLIDKAEDANALLAKITVEIKPDDNAIL
ncbi:MAG: hypothetical protein L0154_14040 [Chloroflexi bacterium]|nr:hypothetical protein [Chloroflexota bacterium]